MVHHGGAAGGKVACWEVKVDALLQLKASTAAVAETAEQQQQQQTLDGE
jgi:hypothetical protein